MYTPSHTKRLKPAPEMNGNGWGEGVRTPLPKRGQGYPEPLLLSARNEGENFSRKTKGNFWREAPEENFQVFFGVRTPLPRRGSGSPSLRGEGSGPLYPAFSGFPSIPGKAKSVFSSFRSIDASFQKYYLLGLFKKKKKPTMFTADLIVVSIFLF